MKEAYAKPAAVVETFAVADVITTSSPVSGGGGKDPIQTEPEWD